jgi:hypothetical protein
VGKPLKKTHYRSGGTGVRTRDLPNVKCGARRSATVLGEVRSEEEMLYSSHLFLLDLHWNPQLVNQAQDRICRMGQTKKNLRLGII